ncbi:MAG: Dihydrolipoamide acetyltransferase component of pyruvate dehydrogenase complex [Ilumatobacteraceae bacterium]|nr:Dihydrolipoamide acetyltransferase component of pyruvate dehydrogenase complex [Ilumatobacteraceae bacterium]
MAEFDFPMPDVGEGLSEAEIVEWLVAVGDHVTEDQPVVVVQTDKAVVDIPAPAPGRLVAHGAAVGEVVLIGSTLFRLDAVGAAPVLGAHGHELALAPAATILPEPASAAHAATAARRPKASPATRQRALDLGVVLAEVTGTGPGGRITTADVDAAKARPTALPDLPRSAASAPGARPQPSGEDRVEPLRGTRRQIARSMTESWRTVPHVTELREMDASELIRAHRALRDHLAGRDVKLTLLPLFVAASAAALREHPTFNASLDYDNELITYRARCNIGIAMSTDEGLVVPVVHDADQLSIEQIARRIDELTAAARTRTLTLDQLSGGTFTISNYGSYGTWMGTPIIRPPEAAIVGFGRAKDAVVARDGQPVVRTILPMAVSADHRLNDGHHLGAFVATIERYLADPVLLLAGRPVRHEVG